MNIKKQYLVSFEDFMTQETLDTCTELEKDKLKRVYDTVSTLIKQYDSNGANNADRMWLIDKAIFLDLITHDNLEDFYVVITENVDGSDRAYITIHEDAITIWDWDVHTLQENDIKLISGIQIALQHMAEHHNVFRDMEPPFDLDID